MDRLLGLKQFRIRLLKELGLPPMGEASMVKDPVKVDPKHYKVEFENDKVRVLRIRYGPRERSTMHDHPNAVAVFLEDARARFTYPGGKTENADFKAGQAMWFPAVEHLPENALDKPIHHIFIEFK